MNHRATILVALMACAAAPCLAQTTRLVPSQYPTIQSAINASLNGDTILVAPGSYSGTVNFNGKTLTLTGTGGSGVTTLFGTAGAAVVTFQGGEAPSTVFQGFRITGGGPGVYVHNASPQISNCVINYNFAPSGVMSAAGGVRVTIDAGTGSPTFTNCTITANLGFRGGGMSFEASGTGTSSPTVIGCNVSGNTALTDSGPNPNNGSGGGAGFYISGGVQPAIVTTTISDNIAYTQGGAINNSGTALLVDRCQIRGNSGYSGAAIASSGAFTLVGSLITGNNVTVCPYAQCQQAAVEVSGTVIIQSCTITANTNPISTVGGVWVFGNVTMTNTIVWGNTGIDLFRSVGATVTPSYCDLGVTTFAFGSPNFSADPLFVDPAGGDFHLGTKSPCRDAGSPSPAGLPPADLDGLARIVGPLVDVGVDEIPALTFPGTADGLDLYAKVNGAGDPLASTRPAVVGNLLSVRFESTTGSLVGGVPLFAAELYPNGAPPTPVSPTVWLDLGCIFVYGTISAPPFGFPGLPPEGLTFSFTVPAGLANNTVRFQGFVFSPNALTGGLASSNATEVTL